MFNRSKFYKFAFPFFLIIFLMGCSDSSKRNNIKVVKIAGSTSVSPIMKNLKTSFEEENSDYLVEIQETGSSAGITSTLEGASQIGMSSRDLKEDEKSKGLVAVSFALDGIAVVINPKNNVNNLTGEQLEDIFSGKIKNWSQVGGFDKEIIVVSREEGSGTRGSFEELAGLEIPVARNGKNYKTAKIKKDALYESSTGAVKLDISTCENAIGYISIGSLDESVKTLKINDVEISEENIRDNLYILSREFILCTLGEPNEGSEKFIKYIMSDEGQKIVSQSGYVRMR